MIEIKDIDIKFSTEIITTFLLTFLISLMLSYAIIKLSKKFNLYDMPDSRKLHKNATPTAGGIAFTLASIFGFYLSGVDVDIGFITASIVLMVGGIVDDIYKLTWHKKLFFQCLAITIWLINVNISIIFEKISLHFLPYSIQYIIFFILVIMFINAFNFIDGVDMLAGVLAMINFLFLGSINFYFKNFHLFVICIIILLSIAGFLYFNIYPARIFMGDTGSQVIGFWIMAMITQTFLFQANSIIIHNKITFLLLLGSVTFLPFIDAMRVTIVRIIKRIPPYLPHKDHLHHVLLKNNFKVKEVVAIICFFNFLVIFLLLLVYLNKPILTIMSIIFLKIQI